MTKQKNPAEEKVQAAYQEALSRYGERENVTAIDIGYKYKKGKVTDQISVRIHVREKSDETALEAADLFPEEILGVAVDVIQATYAPHRGLQVLSQRRQRRDPVQPGLSVAHPNVSAGTLGALVIDNVTGQPGILSNWHVLVGSAEAKPGDPIVQPGPADGGRLLRDTIATLERSVLGPDGDAAVALLTGTRQVLPEQFETNQLLQAARMPSRDEILEKSGRTTGVTRGRVDGLGRYFIHYSVGRVGIDGFKLVTAKDGNPDNEEISAGGDSGSVWYDPQTGQGVGLHFAGETNADPKAEHAVACFLPRVLETLNISLLSTTSSVTKPISVSRMGVPEPFEAASLPNNATFTTNGGGAFDIDIRIKVRPKA